MTQRKLKSLLVQIKMETPILEGDDSSLRDYALEVFGNAKAKSQKKIIDWYLNDETILDEIVECIGEIWDLRQVGAFLRKFDPKLKKP